VVKLDAMVLLLLSGTFLTAADWDGLPVPAQALAGHEWKLLPVSDDFSYEAKPLKKPQEFHRRWKTRFINSWTGPGDTFWNSGHSYTVKGKLGIEANRSKKSGKISAGIVTSKNQFCYPLFIEARAKISDQVLASCVWMLSEDSTEEIDILEAYGSGRKGQEWFAERLHLSHHVFVRKPFQDYQPTDAGTWYKNGKIWRQHFVRVGVYWRDPWHLEYYVDGELVRTVSGEEIIDPKGFTHGHGLSKPMSIIINKEDQDWRREQGVTPTDEELANPKKSIMWVDWVRVYQAVKK
jgi:agarase